MEKSIITLGLICALALTGCSNNSSSESNDKNSSNEKTIIKKDAVTKYYQNLSKADKKKVNFKFSLKKTERWHSVSVKISNNSDKTVKFKLNQFFISELNGNKVATLKEGTITVKPNKSLTYDKLFGELSSQIINKKDVYFIYVDLNNKLAKLNFSIPDDNPNNSNSSNSNSSNSSELKKSTTDQATKKSGHVITSADMAEKLYMHAMCKAPGMEKYLTVTETPAGYKISDSDAIPADITYIDYKGEAQDDQGNITGTYDQMVGPTQIQPEGFVYNGHHYMNDK
ncbi:hypothetical protein [Companilactobacillus mishanensis]|uniref:Lipoprotein n=1 Tax=Companilactobacillus mishanensis TaxID=2486008 RepID=A0ABW9PA01_9LACO|nr:hypothetical protein [Companilactobacillus mishanensis]MQS45909.1 hypothetical protein [Companilactobacillus mishanensis]